MKNRNTLHALIYQYVACFIGLGRKRITGIEPATPAWEANVLPLNYIRIYLLLTFLP